VKLPCLPLLDKGFLTKVHDLVRSGLKKCQKCAVFLQTTMKEVFRHSNAGLVSVCQSLLESAGFQTFVRNSDSQQAIVGGLLTAIVPLPDFWPTLCVVNDADYSAAMNILRDEKNTESEILPDWPCQQCRESVPAHFILCWNCGHSVDR
jgi:hypothetical protein